MRDFLVYDILVEEPRSNIPPPILETNIHTAIWGLIGVYLEEEENENRQKAFTSALSRLEEDITPSILRKIIKQDLPDFDISHYGILKYSHMINNYTEDSETNA